MGRLFLNKHTTFKAKCISDKKTKIQQIKTGILIFYKFATWKCNNRLINCDIKNYTFTNNFNHVLYSFMYNMYVEKLNK